MFYLALALPNRLPSQLIPLRRALAAAPGTSYKLEYNRWKRSLKKGLKVYEIDDEFDVQKRELMRGRETEYNLAMETLQVHPMPRIEERLFFYE